MRLWLRRLWMKSPPTTSSIVARGELGHDQATPEAGGGAGGARLAGNVLEHRNQTRLRAVERRKEPEEHARRERGGAGERDRTGVDHQRDELDDFRRQERADEAQRPLRHEQPDRPAEGCQHTRFGEQLRQQVPPRRADREPHRHLGRAGARAGEQEVRDVGARDEENDGGDDEQQDQDGAGHVVQPALSPAPVLDRQRPRDEPRPGVVARADQQRRLHLGENAAVQRLHRRTRLLSRDPRLEAREQVEPVALAVPESPAAGARRQPAVHRDRHEDLGTAG